MAKKNSQIGRKRPQIDISLVNIELDNKNPRLAEEHQRGTQFDILKVLYEEFDLDEIAYSMAENGYFDEEPIVVIPDKLPKNFKWDEDVNKFQADFEKLIDTDKNIKFIVVEGNRRIATAKLLTDKSLREGMGIREEDFPVPRDKGIYEDLKLIPSIIYKDRKDISPYLGVRHITGVLKWEAYAKARYIASKIAEERSKGRSTERSIQEVQKKVGDRTDVIKKQYMYYKILEQVQDDLDFDVSEITDRFSLITVAVNSPSIRRFIGVPSYKEADLNKPLVPQNKLRNLDILLTWIFGKGKDQRPILTDSRIITSRLAPILADKDATEHLLKYGNLEEAYERSGGEKEFLIKKINKAKSSISNVLGYVYKYRADREIKGLVDDLIEAVMELKKMVSGK